MIKRCSPGGLGAQALQVVGLEEVEHLEHGDPLAVGRELPDVVAAIIRRHRIDPGARVVREVFEREQPADLLRVGNHGRGE